jgi:anti-sigma B factor antagonist
MQNLVFSGSGDGACVVADTFAFSAVRGLRVALVADARGVAVLLAGELDLETAPELEQQLAALEESQRTRVVIDLGGVTFMDSAGLKAILAASEFAQSHGHTLVLRRGPRQVQRLIELTGVGDRLTFEDD